MLGFLLFLFFNEVFEFVLVVINFEIVVIFFGYNSILFFLRSMFLLDSRFVIWFDMFCLVWLIEVLL